MSWDVSHFIPGNLIAFASHRTLALVEPAEDHVTEVVWRLVALDESLDAIAEELSAVGLRSLPSFGLARLDDDGVRVLVRGSIVGDLSVSDGSVVVSAAGLQTWIERWVPDAHTIRLWDSVTEGTARFEVLAGVVPAALIERSLTSTDDRAELAESEWSPPGRPRRVRTDADDRVPVASSTVLAPPTLVNELAAVVAESKGTKNRHSVDGDEVDLEEPEAPSSAAGDDPFDHIYG
ncbi:MAG: hypothetical protein ACRDZ2_04180, partial [Ilumatobacteraceae bacterium]